MSVATSDSKVTYQGNGATYTWPFSFPLLDKSHLQVILTDGSGKETALTSNYRVDMEARNVVYPVCNSGEDPSATSEPPVLPSGWFITLKRNMPLSQETDLGDRWPFTSIENALDRLTLQVQQVAEEVGRCVKVGVAATVTPDELIASLREGASAAQAAATAAATASQQALQASESAASYLAASDIAKETCETAATSTAADRTACEAAAGSIGTNVQTATDAAATATTAAQTVSSAIQTVNTAAAAAQTASTGAQEQAELAATAYANLQALLDGSTVAVPAMPVGVPFPWFKTPYPADTLLCNGQSFSAATYPELAAVYASLTLPDMRGVVPRGLDRSRGLDVDGASRTLGSYQADQYKSHTHTYDMDAGAGNTWRFTNNSGEDAYYASGPTGSSGGNETRMKNIACDWLVYAKTPTVRIVQYGTQDAPLQLIHSHDAPIKIWRWRMDSKIDYKERFYQSMSEFAILRKEISDIKDGQARQNERLARMEEKLDSNAGRCLDRGAWMKEVDKSLDDLTSKANQALGAKAVLLGMLGLIGAAIGAAWEAYKK